MEQSINIYQFVGILTELHMGFYANLAETYDDYEVTVGEIHEFARNHGLVEELMQALEVAANFKDEEDEEEIVCLPDRGECTVCAE